MIQSLCTWTEFDCVLRYPEQVTMYGVDEFVGSVELTAQVMTPHQSLQWMSTLVRRLVPELRLDKIDSWNCEQCKTDLCSVIVSLFTQRITEFRGRTPNSEGGYVMPLTHCCLLLLYLCLSCVPYLVMPYLGMHPRVSVSWLLSFSLLSYCTLLLAAYNILVNCV